ncbi:hypothetical protein Micbo1qcDRAFT_176761 [Microdochium bolleyi]|uniref:Uncharacterized protein n=1 Tax=Microdochium bolleyi TaxID=196109 RepID=A0A136IZ97_9PEZI|nr:hypothetical protein Micbo1qcDRAFT_176761 [Microdochium bolleyi]
MWMAWSSIVSVIVENHWHLNDNWRTSEMATWVARERANVPGKDSAQLWPEGFALNKFRRAESGEYEGLGVANRQETCHEVWWSGEGREGEGDAGGEQLVRAKAVAVGRLAPEGSEVVELGSEAGSVPRRMLLEDRGERLVGKIVEVLEQGRACSGKQCGKWPARLVPAEECATRDWGASSSAELKN